MNNTPSNPDRIIKVIWTDDSADILTLFATVVRKSKDMELVGALSSADELVAECLRLNPDVVVLDLTMPGRAPLEVAKELAEKAPDIRVLLFSGYDDPQTVQDARDSGAWGLVSKHGDTNAILTAIRRAANNEMTWPN